MGLKSTGKNELAIAVGVATHSVRRSTVQEHVEELVRLTETAGAKVIEIVIQERDRIDAATFIGRGKVSEIARAVEEGGIQLVVFDDDLSPVQLRNLEKGIPAKIIDRSGLILDIFASRAKSKEAMTQVELAQLQYFLPRLTRQWTHLSKQFGGIGTKGPGETQIETDRRAIRERISLLKGKLEGISQEREVQRKGRRELPRVALVGYTNAGKSTLMKALSDADVLIEDQLFATLDTTVRSVWLPQSKKILLSDTVGFIRKLPTQLVASFRSTLAEVMEADVLLHVIDAGDPQYAERIEVVRATLDDLHAAGKPTLHVFNKIDTLEDRSVIPELAEAYPPSVFISAARGLNIRGLKDRLAAMLEGESVERTLTFKQSDSRAIAQLHEIGEVLEKTYDHDDVIVRVRVSKKNAERLKKYLGTSGKVRRGKSARGSRK